MKLQKIIIGSRGSQLARWQANWVKTILERIHKNLTVHIQIIKTSGDKIQDVPLAKIGGKGLFVKEIEEALLSKDIDIAVHSMKDVPMEVPASLKIAVITRRENPLDALISRNGQKLAELPNNAIIGTSSLRRSSQLFKYRSDFKIENLRGNVDTRLKKLDAGKYDAILLAAAGLIRLGWSERITEEVSHEILLPAMGQGALGIESRVNDTEIDKTISVLDHEETHLAVNAERALVKKLDGGCQVPIGAYATINENLMTVRGLVASLNGEIVYKLVREGPSSDAINIGHNLGSELLKKGADKILKNVLN